MNSEWLDLWLEEWEWRWLFVWADLRGMIGAMIDFDAAGTAYHWRALTPDIRVVALHIVALIEHGVTSVTFIWEEWANDFIADFEAWLLALLGIEVEPDAPAEEHIANLWGSIIALWARFGYEITKSDITVVDWVQAKLGLTDLEIVDTFYTVKGWVQTKLDLVWGSIVAIWARFGPTFLGGDWTVETWVEDKVTAVTQWVLDNYETARLQAEAAALWIAIHGQVLVDWLTDNGQNLVDWYDAYATYYADLYDNYHDLLLEFLQDPGAFIGKYVDQIIIVPPDEPDSWWLAWLLRLILDPIGTVLGWAVTGQALLWAWLIAWIQEHFPPLEEALARLPRPDRNMPTVEDWWKGLREPETDDQIAYVALMDTKLQQILDETILDHPLTAAEFSSLLFPITGES